ncbi:MAG: hypothetical protein DSY37_03670 [Hyperthermus sp.]|nr:MAG: hypothetical protein DSY37_03670 [Hyperthermus sp.]
MSVSGSVLDLRGFRGLIPYRVVERMVADKGDVVVYVDPVGLPLLRLWAAAHGFRVEVHGEGTLRLIHSQGVRLKAPREGEAEAPSLVIDVHNWDRRYSERLADINYIMNNVLRSKPIFRGKLSTASNAVFAGKDLLLRVTVGGVDYFMAIRDLKVYAAAQLGNPLSPRQATNLLRSILESGDHYITVYQPPSGEQE